ncbi:hypothetical protein G9A89_011609 [Geosiphon pyriformis]|nr:hypothetical protein G9A89_011609 [Geosiphon pyriformis]
MSGTGAKKRLTKVSTSGSVNSGSSHKVKKSPGGAKLSSNNVVLKGNGSGQVVRQFNSMDTDGEAFEGEGVSDSKMNTPQAKHFNNGAIVGSLFSSINFDMEEKEEIFLPPFLGGATIPSKFEEIIRSIFISEASMEKATSLARENNIIVNSDLKRQRIRSDQAVQKAVVEFAELEQAVFLAAKWSFLIGKDSVHVTMVVSNHNTWASRDQFRTLLFTLLVGTTAHDFGDLLDGAGKKSCIINYFLETRNRFRCVVVGFESNEMLESAFRIEPILGSMKLSWAKLDLVWCGQYGKFSYSTLEYVSIARLVAFGGKLWAQIVSLVSLSNNPHFGLDPGFGSLSSGASGVIDFSSHIVLVSTSLEAHLASLECSVELLMDKVSGVVCKLENLVLVPSALTSSSQNLVVPVVANVEFDSNMALDNPKPVLPPSFLVSSSTSDLGLSSSRILTSKVGCLESKLMALEASVSSVLEKGMNNPAKQADIVCWHKDMNNVISIITETKLRCKIRSWIANRFSGVYVFVFGLDLGYLSSDVTIIMDVALAKHVYKISEVPGYLLAIKLLFKNKLSVSVLGLYAGTSASMRFSQANKINALIASTVNESSFIILGGDFNKNGFRKSASFKKCGALGLSNSQSVAKTIDYLFVSPNLVNVIVDRSVLDVSGFFDTDHQSVLMLVGLDGLLDMHLCSLHKQANRDCWKYNFKNADAVLWSKFKEATVANSAMFAGGFLEAKECLDLNTMWDAIYRTMCSVVKDALEKNWEFWLVLQDMRKAYNSVGWEHLEKSLVRIKMCGSFICFFKSIHMGYTNQVMTNFGLTDGYYVHDGLDQSEVFSPLFTFVDDTIWVGSSQTATQHILDVASEFYQINDISINNDKTVVIPINCHVDRPSLFISGVLITIARKEESHHYLGIFFLTEGFSKPSLVKAHLDVHFFSNMVLKKTVSNKQFLYLVSAVLYPIVSFRIQFSFIPVSVCHKWDVLIRKSLKLKSGLPSDFLNDTIYHPSFYSLKSFVQIQSEGKVVSLICFANSGGVLGCLFFYRSHDLQVLCWRPVHPLCFPVRIHVSPSNNFLAGLVCILLENSLSLGGYLGNSFLLCGGVPISFLFSGDMALPSWTKSVIAMRWKRLDPCSPVPEWFWLSTMFLSEVASLSLCPPALDVVGPPSIVSFLSFKFIRSQLSLVVVDAILVYTDGSLKGLDTSGCRASAGVFFKDIGLRLGVSAIALALECVPSSGSICLFSDSQSALDACKSELGLICPDFRNQCWNNNLRVDWCKVKSHSGIPENNQADMIADAASLSAWCLPLCLNEHFLVANGGVVFANSRHFVQDIFCSINHAHWEVGLGSKFLSDSLLSDVDWHCSLFVWHPDSHMASGFISKSSMDLYTYFMKALYHQLPVVIRKCLYDRHYPSVLCLHCGKVEVLDHVFVCKFDHGAYCRILDSHMSFWSALFGLFVSSSSVLQLLSTCVSNVSVSMALFKGFVFDGWYHETVSFCSDPKLVRSRVIEFVQSLSAAFRTKVWLVYVKYHAFIKKNGHILLNRSVPVLISGLGSEFSSGVVRLLGVAEAISVHFGYHKQCAFFSGVDNSIVVHIDI